MISRLRNIPWLTLPDWLLGNRLRILMVHSISENPHDPHALSPVEFERQINFLQNKKVISLNEGLKRLQANQPLKNTYVITFDDGLLDFYTTALPIIKRFAYPVTMFLPTALVGKTAVWDSYDQSKPLMNWAQIEDCQRWNVTFGSHTVNHARLTECEGAQLQNELQTSLQTLQNRLEKVVPAIAYPGGYHDARVHRAARDAGYLCGLIASSRWGNGPETDLYQLRRERLGR